MLFAKMEINSFRIEEVVGGIRGAFEGKEPYPSFSWIKQRNFNDPTHCVCPCFCHRASLAIFSDNPPCPDAKAVAPALPLLFWRMAGNLGDGLVGFNVLRAASTTDTQLMAGFR